MQEEVKSEEVVEAPEPSEEKVEAPAEEAPEESKEGVSEE